MVFKSQMPSEGRIRRYTLPVLDANTVVDIPTLLSLVVRDLNTNIRSPVITKSVSLNSLSRFML